MTARWRFLWKHVYLLDMLRISQTIYTCCVLHSICISEGEVDVNVPVRDNPRFAAFIAADNREDDATVTVSACEVLTLY